MGAPKKHLSMLRSYTVADVFTLANGSSGTIAIFLCLNYIAEGRNQFLWIAFLLLFAALGCDIIDGYWSRKSGGNRFSRLIWILWRMLSLFA